MIIGILRNEQSIFSQTIDLSGEAEMSTWDLLPYLKAKSVTTLAKPPTNVSVHNALRKQKGLLAIDSMFLLLNSWLWTFTPGH